MSAAFSARCPLRVNSDGFGRRPDRQLSEGQRKLAAPTFPASAGGIRPQARYIYAQAISTGWPTRFIGRDWIFHSLQAASVDRSMGVSVGPGQTTLTVIPSVATSWATLTVSATTAAFEAQ